MYVSAYTPCIYTCADTVFIRKPCLLYTAITCIASSQHQMDKRFTACFHVGIACLNSCTHVRTYVLKLAIFKATLQSILPFKISYVRTVYK